MTNENHTIIIGGGQAGAQACQSLRQFGYEGAITLIGSESALPYQRPPLSKAYMKGELEESRLYFKPHAWYEDNQIDVRLGADATAIDAGAKTVTLDSGARLAYTDLIIATGARPRPLPVPGRELKGIYDLRDLADVERIRPEMIAGKHLLIVGAGYIGLEAAAVGRQLGLDVTVLERADRVLERVTSPVMSEFFTTEHRSKGVEIRTGAQLEAFEGEKGRVTAARLAGGEIIACDTALTGIGIIPNTELAEAAGLRVENGIIVDENARTSDPHIYAAGDCTVRPLAAYRRTGRLESVHNAIEQGKLAAAAIAGKPAPALDCPWFWSDQYDLKLQIAGLSSGHDELVLRGDPADRKFAAFYLKDGVLIAVDAINSPPEFLASKKLVQAGARPDPAALADLSQSMKDIANAALAI